MEHSTDTRPAPAADRLDDLSSRPLRSRGCHPAFAALLAALLLIPALAHADGGRRGSPRGGGDGFGGDGSYVGAAIGGEDGEGLHRRLPLRRLASFLELTEDQTAEARAIFETARTEAEPLRTARRETAGQLREALDAAAPDPAAVGALVIALHDNREALGTIRQGVLDDLRAILTPEQLERFETLGDARRSYGRGHHRGPRGGGPGGR